jgi:Aspartyl protease/PDZ domain
MKPRGITVPTPVRANNGFPRIELTIGGSKFGFLLDTGASYTMISKAVLEEWSSAANTPWPRHVGAVGAANMGIGKMETEALMTRIPEMRLGDFAIGGAGSVFRPVGTYEKSMSNAMTAPIVGALGGNVLRQFRVEIDYAAGVTYFERSGKDDPEDLNLFGLTLGEAPNHSVAVKAISAAAGKTVREQIRPGDLLRSVDGTPVAGLSLLQIVDRLRGKPGDEKKLELERDGKPFEIQAAVTRLM